MTDYAKLIDPIPVRNQAVKIIVDAGNPASSWLKAAAIQLWVRANIAYVPDPTSGNYAARPEETLACRGGDCEDYSILFCSMCEAVGVRTRIYTAATQHSAHAFAAVYCGPVYPPSLPADLKSFYLRHNIQMAATYSFNSPQDGIWLVADPQDPHVGDLRGLINMGYFSSDSQGIRWTSTPKIYSRS